MPSKRLLFTMMHSAPITRIGYPIGVAVVFLAILFSAFFSYRFFLVMIERVTTLELFEVREGETFHLDAYRTIVPSFTFLSPPSFATPLNDSGRSVVALRNAQSRNDRVILLQELLKNNGWTVTIIEGEVVRGEQLTVIAAKEAQEKEARNMISLLTKKGFIVSSGKPLSKDEKFDIVITLGAY